MRLVKGAEVYSSAGKKLGNLSRVILDPNTREVTHLVIEKGILLTANKIISIDQVNPENEEMILLTTPEQDLENFQDFEEAHYINLDSTEYPGSDVASFVLVSSGRLRLVAVRSAAWHCSDAGLYSADRPEHPGRDGCARGRRPCHQRRRPGSGTD